MVPEPKNPADRNAIAVVTGRGVKIGYIVADRALDRYLSVAGEGHGGDFSGGR